MDRYLPVPSIRINLFNEYFQTSCGERLITRDRQTLSSEHTETVKRWQKKLQPEEQDSM